MEIPFAISARTARLIGLENFANAEGAIVELVKNGYDADADTCIVAIDMQKSKFDSRIFIIDNGCGMTSDDIVQHWMTIGTDDKLFNAYTSQKKRIKSGAKGIGRFALNRLGKKTEMISFSNEYKDKGIIWNVDWTSFDKTDILSNVKANLEEFTYARFQDKIQDYGLNKLPVFEELTKDTFKGTILCISQLNDVWTEDSLNSLLKNLEILIPDHMHDCFELYLYNLSDLLWSGRVNPAEYEDFDYKVCATYHGGEHIEIHTTRNELNLSLLETNFQRVFSRKEMQSYPYRLEDFKNTTYDTRITLSGQIDKDLLASIGQFSFVFYFIKNTIKDDIDKDGNKKYPFNVIDSESRKRWLSKFGGIRIFRDNFRVRPYGENGNDWLNLGRRQAQSPAGAGQKPGGYRIRPNQIAGALHISRIGNPVFEDKSSREGLQENDAFVILKNLLLQIIAEFEKDRNYIMYNLSEQYKSEHPIEAKTQDIVKQALTRTKEQNEDEKNLRILAESYKSLESELSDKEAELSMIRGLASMGISVATFTHELRSVMLRLIPRNDLLKKILGEYLPMTQFEGMRFNNPYKELDNMKSEDEKLYNWLQYSLHSIRRNKRDYVDINMEDYFHRFVKSWEPSLSKKNIEIQLTLQGMSQVSINAFEMDLDSIYNNFATNSINAFLKSSTEKKRISIEVKNDHGYMVVDFIDNGCGLSNEYRSNPEVIFNAFETSTVDNKNNKIGTGMGLFIAKGVVEKFRDSTISLIPVKEGFGIRTIIRIK